MIVLGFRDPSDRIVRVEVRGGWNDVSLAIRHSGEPARAVVMSRLDAKILAAVLLDAAGISDAPEVSE